MIHKRISTEKSKEHTYRFTPRFKDLYAFLYEFGGACGMVDARVGGEENQENGVLQEEV